MNRSMIILAMAASVVGCATVFEKPAEKPAEAKPYVKPASPSCRASKLPFKLGIAGYTYHRQPVGRMLAAMQRMDVHYLCIKDFHLDYTKGADAPIAAFKEQCAAAGVECLAAGPLYYKDEATARKLFEFAKAYGLKTVVVVPYEVKPGAADTWGPNRLESDAMLDVLEKLVKEFDIRAAIHNHGPDIPSLYPTAEAALKRIGARDARIGVCLDVGHERRAGLDPVAFIRAYGDRIYDVHLKNIKVDPVQNFAKEGPRGELDVGGILKALAEVGYAGVCHIEYEKDFEDNLAEVAESVGYFRGVMDTIRVAPKMMPVPAGANALSAEEKAAGFELLFDGRNLPADKWVGVKSDCTEFPKVGWFVKDGCLTMRPQHLIKDDGSWGDLPPEDMKLGGGGDIVTKRRYRDFEFRFDFRLTSAANSGVKYFYNEGVHRSSCEEYQVLEPDHPDSTKGRDGNRRVAALYDIFPAKGADALVRPVGQWNSGRIVAKGRHVEHWLNGVKVLEYERGSAAFRAGVAKSKYLAWQDAGAFWGEAETGRLLLQDHTDSTVSFCNLKVKEL